MYISYVSFEGEDMSGLYIIKIYVMYVTSIL